MGWWGRILLLVALLVIGLSGIALYTEFRMEDVGSLSALGEGEGVYLIVGSDSRENLPPDLGSFGDDGTSVLDALLA